MNKALLLLCLTLPAYASPFHMRAPHRNPDRSPHTRDHSLRSPDLSKGRSGLLSGRIGHRTATR
jgi:hypothetical protein